MPAPSPTPPGTGPRRRGVLRAGAGGLAVVLTAALGGCGVRFVPGPETTPAPRRRPDDDVRDAVVADAAHLLARAGAGAPAQPALLVVVAACAAHLRALGATTRAAASPQPGETPAGGDAQAVAAELAAAAGRALASAQDAGGPLARLVVAVAASRAVLLDGLATAAAVGVAAVPAPAAEPATPTAPTASPTRSGSGDPLTAALQRALAGEHAAVFAYGLIAGRVGAERRGEALADLDAHRVAREDLSAVLLARGATPRAASAGYDAAAPTPQAAALLAAGVEDRLADGYDDVVAAAPAPGSPERASAAGGVLRAARAAHRWGSARTSFPGVAGLGEDGDPVPTTTPTTTPTAVPTATPTATPTAVPTGT